MNPISRPRSIPAYTCQPDDVLVRLPANDCWLLFRRPRKIITAYQIDQVVSAIQEIEAAAGRSGLHAAGFISYEAASGFDASLKTRPLQGFPLVWFGLYTEPDIIPCSDFDPPAKTQERSLRWEPTVSREEYDAAVASIKECIAQGQTYQVNYTYRFRSTFEQEPFPFFLELTRAQNAPYAAFIHTERFTICSASPELFFSLEGDRIASRPMKGTAARGRTQAEDLTQRAWLQNSLKDQAENVMIVDMVRNDIGRVAWIGSVQVTELFALEKYPTVWQMVSTVTGDTGAGLGEILKALFPPASITGAPKARTMEIIAALENTPRRIYCGCIGFFSPRRKAQFNVAIRTLLVDRETAGAEYGIGGGITWDSIDAAEFDESRAKARILTVQMPRFSLLETMLWTPEEGYFLLDLHLNRLEDSAHYFSFPVDLAALRCHLRDLSADWKAGARKVRLLVDERGQITTQVEAFQQRAQTSPLRVCFSPSPVDSSDVFLYHKTTHRQVYEQARKACPEVDGHPWDDVLLWNEKGELTESCLANLLVELDGALYTPPVECGLLAGTYRKFLIEQGKVKERVLRIEDLESNPKIYLINSVRKRQDAQLSFPSQPDNRPARAH